jgi:c-di-GMP-binding flagellar brake protein YcgR
MLDRLDSVFSNFHRMLSDLSEQVAHLVALQEGRASHVAPDLRCRVINISGAGLAFECQEALAPGTMLRMTFDLQRFPYRSILCLGDVVRRQSRPADASPTTPHLIFAHFTHIREEDRDRIIHYVFKMQRRMLRSRRQKAVAET